MTVEGRFSLDTNILVYAVDRDAGDRRELALEIVDQAARGDCVLTLQALAEFFHATTRKRLLPAAQARALIGDWRSLFTIAVADANALSDAMDAVSEHRVSFWDAMLWATARRAGCSALVSEDLQDGRRLGGVEIVNPFSQDQTRRLQLLLNPRE